MNLNPGRSMGRVPPSAVAEGFAEDTQEVGGVQVEGHDVRVLNPRLIEQWTREDVKLNELPERLKGKIPTGYRLPTEAEVAGLKAEKQDKFGRLAQAAGAGERFNFLTDDGQGPTRSTEWSVDGSSFEEQNKGTRSEEKKEPKLRSGDLIFLVKAESSPGANK